MKDKDHMIISIDLFMIKKKTLNIEGIYFHTTKAIYDKATLTSYSMVKR